MAKNVKALMTMLCCMGLISVIPACWRDRDNKKDGYHHRDKKQTKQKHTKKEKTVKQDNSNRPGGAKKVKTVESVETSSSY